MPLKAQRAAPYMFNWTGCYIGGNVGGAWSNKTGDLVAHSAGFNLGQVGVNVPVGLGVDSSGVIGGGQIGCNWQSGTLVWGIETDIQGSGVSGTSNISIPAQGIFTATNTHAHDRLDWFGTLRARLGFTVTPMFLLYATGGLAYGSVSDDVSWIATPNTAGTFFGSGRDTRAGWTVGAGGEYAFGNNWSLKAEYLFVDLRNTQVTLLDPVHFPADFLTYRFKHQFNVGRVGLNYRF